MDMHIGLDSRFIRSNCHFVASRLHFKFSFQRSWNLYLFFLLYLFFFCGKFFRYDFYCHFAFTRFSFVWISFMTDPVERFVCEFFALRTENLCCVQILIKQKQINKNRNKNEKIKLCENSTRQYHNQSDAYEKTMRYINMGFTGMFSVETVLKIIGFGIKVGINKHTATYGSIRLGGRGVNSLSSILETFESHSRHISNETPLETRPSGLRGIIERKPSSAIETAQNEIQIVRMSSNVDKWLAGKD